MQSTTLHNLTRNATMAVLLLSVLAPGHAPAQDRIAQYQGDTVEEVMVTGQKREEALLESDLSVTVFDERSIQEIRLRDLRRIDDLVPNVQFNESGQLSRVFVSIRGIESNPYIVNRAALYIDGIPFRELSNAVLSQLSSSSLLHRSAAGTAGLALRCQQ